MIHASKISAEQMGTNAQLDVSLQSVQSVVNATTAIWWPAPKENQPSLVNQLWRVTAVTGKNLKKTTSGGTAKIATTLFVKSVSPQTIEESSLTKVCSLSQTEPH